MLSGTLDDFTLADIFRLLSWSKRTGSLQVERRAGTGRVLFRSGEIYYAESSLSREPLGQKLIRAGALTEGQLRRALDEHAANGKRVGQILVEKGDVTQSQLEAAVRSQIEDAVFDLLSWETGEFTWEPDYEIDVEMPIFVSVENLIMEASRRLDELEVIRRAVYIADRAFEAVAARLRPGMTEREVAWRLEVEMRERGADELSFPIIVASGPNGAKPHHRASDRPIQPGEPIVIDMGCRVDGYCSDMTRTITLGEPDGRFWEIYQVVLRAQQTCEDGLRAGMLGKDGDALARDVISGAGYGEQFGHGTGHGVGLLIHEAPYLSRTRGETPLVEHAVVTVEPGIDRPGWGGVRIEDMVVIGAKGCQILTTAHKFPVIDVASGPA